MPDARLITQNMNQETLCSTEIQHFPEPHGLYIPSPLLPLEQFCSELLLLNSHPYGLENINCGTLFAQEAESETDENSISLIEFLLDRTPPTKQIQLWLYQYIKHSCWWWPWGWQAQDSFHPSYLVPKLPHKAASHKLCWEQRGDHRKPWASLENCLAEWPELGEQPLEPCDSRDNTGDNSVQQLQTFPAGFLTTMDKELSASCARTLLLATAMPLIHTKH